ncbi:MAG: uroporphyrinogen-III synthase [Tumebacillaceae bacterium]
MIADTNETGLPLAGTRIVVTRSRSQASELCRLLEAYGGEPYEFPVINIEWPEDLRPLDATLARLAEFDWVLFTSPNGVEMFWERLLQTEIDPQSLAQTQVAAVGPKTAAALEKRGVTVAAVAEEFVGEGLLQTIGDRIKPGDQILLPRANIARKQLPDALRARGCDVTEVDAYRTLAVTEHADELVAQFREQKIDVVTFTSSSTVKNFVKALEGHDVKALLQGVLLAAIGPITAQTAEDNCLHIDVMPSTYTIPDLVDAVVRKIKG